MPVYLEGDDQARIAATGFVQKQIDLTQTWRRRAKPQSTSRSFRKDMESLFGATSSNEVPYSWTQLLIQTGDDRHYDRYHRQLAEPVRSAAKDFIDARNQLLAFSK